MILIKKKNLYDSSQNFLFQEANDWKKREEQDLKMEIESIKEKLGACRICSTWHTEFKKLHSIPDDFV